MLNGTLYIVTDEPSKAPDRSVMISIGVPIEPGAVEQAKRVPTDKEMRIISPREAKVIFGPDAELIDGVSVSSLLFHPLSVLYRIISFYSGLPTMQTNCKFSCSLPLCRFPPRITFSASHTTTIGLLSYSLAFGEHTPPLTHLLIQQATQPSLHHGA
jgi:hypothetical protein